MSNDALDSGLNNVPSCLGVPFQVPYVVLSNCPTANKVFSFFVSPGEDSMSFCFRGDPRRPKHEKQSKQHHGCVHLDSVLLGFFPLVEDIMEGDGA